MTVTTDFLSLLQNIQPKLDQTYRELHCPLYPGNDLPGITLLTVTLAMTYRELHCSPLPWQWLTWSYTALRYPGNDLRGVTLPSVSRYPGDDLQGVTLLSVTPVMTYRELHCSTLPWQWLTGTREVGSYTALRYPGNDLRGVTLLSVTLVMTYRELHCYPLPW